MTEAILPIGSNNTGVNEWSDVYDQDVALRDVINGELDNGNLSGSAGITVANLAAVPKARARRTGSSQSVSNATFAAVTFDLEVQDNDNIWASGSATRFTCRTAGLYLFSA
jgi:hypothetical protein